MPYIDADYYNNDYMGEPADSPEQLERFIRRASDLVDQAVGYQISCIGFDNLAPFIRELIKKAVAAQVEYYALNGGSAELDAGFGTSGAYNNVTVGAFSYGRGRGTIERVADQSQERISPTTLDYLRSTGMLYRGIGGVFSYGC